MLPPHPDTEPSLREKLAQDQGNAAKWAQVAATPGLSPQAAAAAAGIARSFEAAASLSQKALRGQANEYGHPHPEKLRPEFTLPSGEQLANAAVAEFAIARLRDNTEANLTSPTPSAARSVAPQLSKPLAETAPKMPAIRDDGRVHDGSPDITVLGANRRKAERKAKRLWRDDEKSAEGNFSPNCPNSSKPPETERMDFPPSIMPRISNANYIGSGFASQGAQGADPKKRSINAAYSANPKHRMRNIILCSVAGIAVLFLAWPILRGVDHSASARKVFPKKAQNECVASVFAIYNQATLALLAEQAKISPIATSEFLIARRRLQENYCAKFARCAVPTQPTQVTAMEYSMAFGSCLRDETREQYDLKPEE